MPTSKPSWQRESTDAEVAARLCELRAHPRRVTELAYRSINGWHVLSYRALVGEVSGDGRILVTQSYERYAELFRSLYEERRLNGAPRKRPTVATQRTNQRKNEHKVDPSTAAHA